MSIFNAVNIKSYNGIVSPNGTNDIIKTPQLQPTSHQSMQTAKHQAEKAL